MDQVHLWCRLSNGSLTILSGIAAQRQMKRDIILKLVTPYLRQGQFRIAQRLLRIQQNSKTRRASSVSHPIHSFHVYCSIEGALRGGQRG